MSEYIFDDLDDFDEQSQEELLGYNFLSLEDIERGIVGDDPFEGNRTNKIVREISNEIAIESPFGKRSLFYGELREISFGKIPRSGFDGHWKYKIIHDYNATLLIKEFEEENTALKNSKGTGDEVIDFIVYAEKDDFTISLGRVLLIKMSDAMLKFFYEYKGNEDLTEYWAKHIYNQKKHDKTFQFEEDEIADAFLDSIKLQTAFISDISVLDIQNYVKRIAEGISNFLHEDIKFSREQWDPTLKSDNYLFKKPEDAVNYFVHKSNDLVKKLNQLKSKLQLIKSFKIIGIELQTPLIGELINILDSLIKSIQEFKNWLIKSKDEVALKIAYICGIWNGMIEFLAGIVDVVLLAINIAITEIFESYTNLELLELRETIEELLAAFLKDPIAIVEASIQSVEDYVYDRYTDSALNTYQLQYNEGEDTILAIDIVVSIVTVVKGIAKLAKLLPKFTKWVDSVLKKRKSKRIAKSFKRLENAWKDGWTKEKVLENPKGSRPDPEKYLKKEYIQQHIELFEKEGVVSRIVPKDKFEEFGIGKPDIGKTEFVSRKSDIDDILMLSLEDQSKKLGIPFEQIEKGYAVRIDFKLSKEVKVEMPSGNEFGANEQWLPGGVLPEGNLEAIVRTEGLKENIHYTVKDLKK